MSLHTCDKCRIGFNYDPYVFVQPDSCLCKQCYDFENARMAARLKSMEIV